jgi:hypothetical protein
MPAPAVLTSDQLSAMWNLMRMGRRRRYDASIRTQVEPRDAVHARALAAPILAREARRSCPESSALSDLNRVVALQRKDRDGPTIDAHETQRRDVVQNSPFARPRKGSLLPGNATSSQSQLVVQDCKFAL